MPPIGLNHGRGERPSLSPTPAAVLATSAFLPARGCYRRALGVGLFLVASALMAGPPPSHYHRPHGSYGFHHTYHRGYPSRYDGHRYDFRYGESYHYGPYSTWPYSRAYGSRNYPFGAYSIHPPPRPKTKQFLNVVIGPAQNPAVQPEKTQVRRTSSGTASTYPSRSSAPYSSPQPEPSGSLDPNSAAAQHEGWQFLAQGDYQKAVAAFATLAYQSPRSGLPKIGYGLSNALGGNDHSATYAIRRAFRYDPESANYPPIGPELTSKLRSLQEHYQTQTGREPQNPDANFMLAAISHFLHDEQTAYAAIQEAEAAGDHSLSMHNLKGVISEHLHGTQLFAPDTPGE